MNPNFKVTEADYDSQFYSIRISPKTLTKDINIPSKDKSL